MPDYVRVANFEGDDAALDAMVKEINSAEGPPEGVPAKRITVLTNRQGQIVIVIRFGSQEDLETGAATLDGMSPPDDAGMRRVSVDTFEVVLEREAP
jgi:hypothetical protein